MLPITDVAPDVDVKFPFGKYTEYILAVVPKADLVGISIIRYCNWDKPDVGNDFIGLARYCPTRTSTKCVIEVNVGELIKTNAIPRYSFDTLTDITAFLLTKYIYHEIGHHVCEIRKRRMSENECEKFCNKYAVAGFYAYLRSREKIILREYLLASYWVFSFGKEARQQFARSRREIKDWLATRKDVKFP